MPISTASVAAVHPADKWVTQQAPNFVTEIEASGERVTDVIHNWGTKYTQLLDDNKQTGSGERTSTTARA